VKGEPLEPRRVIVVIGDGHDNASKKTLDEVVEIAQRNLGRSTASRRSHSGSIPSAKRT